MGGYHHDFVWYSKYSLRAFFRVAHFFIGGIVPEILILVMDFVFCFILPISFILIPNESSLQELSNGMLYSVHRPHYMVGWSGVCLMWSMGSLRMLLVTCSFYVTRMEAIFTPIQ